jgi:hypothetical protein
MYLVYQFTKLIDLTGELSKLAGYTARVSQLMELLTFIASQSHPTDLRIDDHHFDDKVKIVSKDFSSDHLGSDA